MTSRLSNVIVGCRDPERLATFWCAALGYVRGNAGDGWLAIEHPDDERAAVMAFVVTPAEETGRSSVHVDITPVGTTQYAEVVRLTALGARRLETGPSKAMPIMMADPEENEFCVLPGSESAGG